jgi:hypothetical protein
VIFLHFSFYHNRWNDLWTYIWRGDRGGLEQLRVETVSTRKKNTESRFSVITLTTCYLTSIVVGICKWTLFFICINYSSFMVFCRSPTCFDVLTVIILKKAQLFAPRKVVTANRHNKKKSKPFFTQQIKWEVGSVHWPNCARMKIALEENLHAIIFRKIACRTSNRMCALLIGILLFTINSVYIHFPLL